MQKVDCFKRANFFAGLKANTVFWNDSEDYHFRKESLYNYLFHGYGVVNDFLQSLNVHAENTKGGLVTVVVGSGMAFDGYGHPVFLYEPKALVLDPKKFRLPCTVYVVMSYVERMEDFYENDENPDMQGYEHKMETACVEITDEVPDCEKYIELARIRLEDVEGKGVFCISNNERFSCPAANSIDLRFVPFASRVKKGLSSYLQSFVVSVLEHSIETVDSCSSVLPLNSLRNAQSVFVTARMIFQLSGVFFDEMLNVVKPMFSSDHAILFEISEWERNHPEDQRHFTSLKEYDDARKFMYEMGDEIKNYSGSYEEIDRILNCHSKIMEALKNILVKKEISADDIQFISYRMPEQLYFDHERFTLVDSIDMTSSESVENHNLHFADNADCSVSSEVFSYPDGVLVRDSVRRWIGGRMKFNLKNLVKNRRTLLIRRSDVFNGDYKVNVSLDGNVSKHFVVEGKDTVHRWRNLYVDFSEDEMKNYSPEVSFDIGDRGRDNSGSIWIYQIL